jgi:hypothetical protein
LQAFFREDVRALPRITGSPRHGPRFVPQVGRHAGAPDENRRGCRSAAHAHDRPLDRHRWLPAQRHDAVGNALGAAEAAIVTPEAQFATEALAAVAVGQLPPDPRAGSSPSSPGTGGSASGMSRCPPRGPTLRPARTVPLCSAILGHIVADYARRHGKPEARFWIDHTPEHLRAVPCC